MYILCIYIYNHNGFFAPQFHERKYQLPSTPLTIALTPPPHSSHDYLPNLTLSVGMDLDS